MTGKNNEIKVARIIIRSHVYFPVGSKLSSVDHYLRPSHVSFPGKMMYRLNVTCNIGSPGYSHECNLTTVLLEKFIKMLFVETTVRRCSHKGCSVVVSPGKIVGVVFHSRCYDNAVGRCLQAVSKFVDSFGCVLDEYYRICVQIGSYKSGNYLMSAIVSLGTQS